jgi:hypothetical protein
LFCCKESLGPSATFLAPSVIGRGRRPEEKKDDRNMLASLSEMFGQKPIIKPEEQIPQNDTHRNTHCVIMAKIF